MTLGGEIVLENFLEDELGRDASFCNVASSELLPKRSYRQYSKFGLFGVLLLHLHKELLF